MNDFVTKGHPEQFVSTAALPTVIKKWKHHVAASTTIDKAGSLHAIELVLGRVHWSFVNKRFDQFQDYIERSGASVLEWPLISLSISALGWTLEVAAPLIYNLHGPGTSGPGKWGSLSSLKTRLLDAGWSNGEITNYAREFCVDGLYYFGFLESPRKHQNCRNCVDPKCTRDVLSERGYVAKHAEGCQKDCQDWNVSKEVLEVVRNGKTPLVIWKDSRLMVWESDLEDVYLAISHVYVYSKFLSSLTSFRWSDGMGNPTENALPACQLSQIQQMADKLYSRKRKNQKRHRLLFGP